MTRRYCLALVLKDDPDLIAGYERQHESVWPEITRSIRDAGIEDMEIYRVGNRLCMVMEVSDTFSFEAKAAADLADPQQRYVLVPDDRIGILVHNHTELSPELDITREGWITAPLVGFADRRHPNF